jgi:hypothetical protein
MGAATALLLPLLLPLAPGAHAQFQFDDGEGLQEAFGRPGGKGFNIHHPHAHALRNRGLQVPGDNKPLQLNPAFFPRNAGGDGPVDVHEQQASPLTLKLEKGKDLRCVFCYGLFGCSGVCVDVSCGCMGAWPSVPLPLGAD